MNDSRRIWLLALAGVFVGGGIGYAFGRYVFPQLNENFGDGTGPGWMFGWMLGIGGGLGGARWGNVLLRKKRKLAQKQARLEKYADHLERFKQEKEEAEAAAQERERLRAARFGDDDDRERRRSSRR